MVAEFTAAADKLKASGTLKDYIVSDATGNTTSQIQQVQNMIASGVDAIVIDANSETALNPAIEAAHKAGIVVVAYDNTVTSPYAIEVSVDQVKSA
jgi:ribose transport system substrate-binding protein